MAGSQWLLLKSVAMVATAYILHKKTVLNPNYLYHILDDKF